MQRYKLIILIPILAILIFGCAIGSIPHNSPQIDPNTSDYSVLGQVRIERKSWRFLGVSFNFMQRQPEIALMSGGGFRYIDLLDEARRRYPRTDAVIDIRHDYRVSFEMVIFQVKTHTITGIAVRYHPDQVYRQRRW